MGCLSEETVDGWGLPETMTKMSSHVSQPQAASLLVDSAFQMLCRIASLIMNDKCHLKVAPMLQSIGSISCAISHVHSTSEFMLKVALFAGPFFKIVLLTALSV